MNHIVTTELKNLRYTLSNEIKGVFGTLKSVFKEHANYLLFAEPAPLSGDKIAWYTDIEGTIIRYDALAEEDRRTTEIALQNYIQGLFEITRQYSGNDLYNLVENCTKIPSTNDIYLVKNTSENKVILTQWGFVADKPGAEKGVLSFIVYAKRINFKLQVIFTDHLPVIQRKVNFSYEGVLQDVITDDEGYATIDKVKIGSSVVVSTYDDAKNIIVHKEFICSENTENLLIINKPPLRKDTYFRVLSAQNTPVNDFEIYFEYEKQTIQKNSNQSGQIILSQIQIGTNIKTYYLLDGKETNIQYFLRQEDEEERIIKLPAKLLNMLFKVIDAKSKPIKNATIIAKNNLNQVQQLITDDNGYATLLDIEEGSNVEVSVLHDKKKIKKIVKCDASVKEYIFKFKNIKWLWLLLLLIPLALFIPLKRTYLFKTIDSINRGQVSNTNLNIKYKYEGSSNFLEIKTTTNQTGEAVVDFGSISVFKWLFSKPVLKGKLIASCACYKTDTTLLEDIIYKKNGLIPLHPLVNILKFKVVVDDSTKEPLPDAKVKIISLLKTNSKVIKDTLTDLAGEVVSIQNACANLVIIGSAEGFISDTIKGSCTNLFSANIEARLLKLKPIKHRITFYVKNLKTQEPVPDAKVDLEINQKIVQSNRTNINGSAGVQDASTEFDLLEVANIKLVVKKIGFYDTTLVGNVRQLLTASKAQKTMYLRPQNKIISLRILDKTTQEALENVQLTITYNGNELKEVSNSNGIVTIAPLPVGTMVTIVTKKQGYYDNTEIVSKKIETLIGGEILMVPVEPPIPPCNASSDENHKGVDVVKNEYDMGKLNGKFRFDYFTDTMPDEISIYCSRKNDTSSSSLLWTSGSVATGTKLESVLINFNCKIITVVVNGGSTWKYNVHCPE